MTTLAAEGPTSDKVQRAGMVVLGAFGLAACVVAIVAPWQYTLALCGAFCLCTASFLRPDWGVRALILLVPFTTASVNFSKSAPWNFTVGNKNIDLVPVYAAVVLAAVLGNAARRLSGLDKHPPGALIGLPVLAVLAYAPATLAWSTSLPHGIFQLLILLMNVAIFFLVAAHVRDERALDGVVRWFVASALIQAAAHVAMFFGEPYVVTHALSPDWKFNLNVMGGFFQDSGMPMVDGGFMDHHEFALLCNLALAVAFGALLAQRERPRRVALALCLALLITVVLHTQSRAGIGSLLVMTVAGLIFFRSTRGFLLRGVALFFVGLVLAYYAQGVAISGVTGKDTTPRLFMLGSKMVKTKNVIDPGLKGKNTGRMDLWRKAVSRYRDYPVGGFGVGHLKKLCQAPHAHSIFLSFVFDFGLIGLAAIVAIVATLTRRFVALLGAQRTRSQVLAVAFGTGLVAIAFHGQFDFEYNTTLLWLYLGMTVAAFRIAARSVAPQAG